MNRIAPGVKQDYNNIAISFDGSIEQAKELLKGIDNDIFDRLVSYVKKDLGLFHLFTITFNKVISNYGNDLKGNYNIYEKNLKEVFLLNDNEIAIFKEIVLGKKTGLVIEDVRKSSNDIF